MRKNTFKKLTALLLVLMLVLSSVPITASAAEVQLTGNDHDGYSVNMPKTGTDTLDLSDRSNSFTLHVYDNGGADANYSNNCTGTMRIIAASDCVLRFSGSGSSESGYDYLRLYDGDTDTVIGSQKNDGTFTIDTAMTSGNVLKIYFYSDSSKTLSGFDLTVTVVKRSSLATLTFNAGDGTGTMAPSASSRSRMSRCRRARSLLPKTSCSLTIQTERIPIIPTT